MTKRDLFLAALEIEDPADRSAFVNGRSGPTTLFTNGFWSCSGYTSATW